MRMRFARTAVLALLTFLIVPLALPPSSAAEEIQTYQCRGLLNENQVVVYYFQRKFGCQSCRVIETALPETIERNYASLLKDGRLSMCVVNLDDPANRHFLEKFDILANSVVIVEKKAGKIHRFKNLEAIWEISQDPDAISQLLLQEVSSFLPQS